MIVAPNSPRRARSRAPRRRRAREAPAAGDREEHAERRGAERAGDRFVAVIDLFEPGAHGANKERQAHDRHREDHRAPGEHDVDPDCGEHAADRAAGRKEQQQDEPRGDRRHHERQRHERLDEQAATKPPPREQPRQQQPGGTMSTVAASAVRSVKRVICQMSIGFRLSSESRARVDAQRGFSARSRRQSVSFIDDREAHTGTLCGARDALGPRRSVARDPPVWPPV